ncbi:hypothetical protein [Oligoflexus tunisiensis]|uniref:hypothetical protein n=1 Tax=Oligoflexus tunisiensis TaxID=708132 RepID=UPI001C404AD4|nr:hypothetical protein [Oligoflexus tunisiensis]
MILNLSCGFKRIGPHYFDRKCHRDLPGIWEGENCPKSEAATQGEGSEEGEEGTDTPCDLAINPSLCIRDGIEASVWRSEAREANIAFNYDLSYQSYYEFHANGSYTHYFIFTHPFLSKRYYEKRQGMIGLLKNDVIDSIFWAYTLDFTLESSSCDGHATPSLFNVFDSSNKSHIGRSEQQLSFRFPDIDFEVEIQSFSDLIAAFVLNFYEPAFEVLFAPLTPNYWKEIITGPHYWDEQTTADLASTLTSAEELCFSEDGFQSLVPKLSIPVEVQLILLSQ